jgi:quercetin dioxygenase-like cupin family protein
MSDEAVEFVEEVCGIYFRSVFLPKAGMRVAQHTHDHDHATYCGAGRALVIVDGESNGEVVAGRAVAVLAGKKHEFVALEDGTRLTCVHDVASAESIKRKGL